MRYDHIRNVDVVNEKPQFPMKDKIVLLRILLKNDIDLSCSSYGFIPDPIHPRDPQHLHLCHHHLHSMQSFFCHLGSTL